MANLKLNSNRAETNSAKIRRYSALKKTVNRDQSLLQPATDLSKFAKKLFYTIKKENKQLSNSDNYLLNLLCSQYDLFIKMNDHIIKNGAVTSKGKRSAETQILKATIDEITKLSSQLEITPKNRISSDYHAQDQKDPVKEAVNHHYVY